MKAIKLNAQVQLTNLQAMYERGKATSDHWQRRQLELEYQDRARLQGRGPHTAGGHGRAGVARPALGRDPPACRLPVLSRLPSACRPTY